MTEDGTDSPDVPTYDPATVAWTLYQQTLTYVATLQFQTAEAVALAFSAGYRAGVADANARGSRGEREIPVTRNEDGTYIVHDMGQ